AAPVPESLAREHGLEATGTSKDPVELRSRHSRMDRVALLEHVVQPGAMPAGIGLAIWRAAREPEPWPGDAPYRVVGIGLVGQPALGVPLPASERLKLHLQLDVGALPVFQDRGEEHLGAGRGEAPERLFAGNPR